VNQPAIFATSGGGGIGLELVLRHPELIRGAVIHEPVILNVLGDQLPAMMAGLKDVEAQGGPRAATEQLLRRAAGDVTYEAMEPELRERMLATVRRSLALKSRPSYLPSRRDGHRGDQTSYIKVLIGTETVSADPSQLPHTMAFVPAVCGWLAGLVNSPLGRLSGRHPPYYDRPATMAAELRPYLREISSR